MTQTVNANYDTYHGVVVAAPSEKIALTIHPGGVLFGSNKHDDNWVQSVDQIIITLIGKATDDNFQGVILFDYLG